MLFHTLACLGKHVFVWTVESLSNNRWGYYGLTVRSHVLPHWLPLDEGKRHPIVDTSCTAPTNLELGSSPERKTKVCLACLKFVLTHLQLNVSSLC
jgi:hypothetical protein